MRGRRYRNSVKPANASKMTKEYFGGAPRADHHPLTHNDVSKVKVITKKELAPVIKDAKPSVVIFVASWLGNASMMVSVLNRLANDKQFAGKVNFYQLDIESSPDLNITFGITQLPTITIFKGGDILDKISGMINNTRLRDRLSMAIG